MQVVGVEKDTPKVSMNYKVVTNFENQWSPTKDSLGTSQNSWQATQKRVNQC